MDWPWCSSASSASAALGSDSLPWERGGAGRRPSRQGPWSSALSNRSIPPVGPSSSLHLTHSSVPSPGTPAVLLLCKQPTRRNSKALRDCRNLSWNLLVFVCPLLVSAASSPLARSPAVQTHSTRASPSSLNSTSSAHTQSDRLAVNIAFRHYFLNFKLILVLFDLEN